MNILLCIFYFALMCWFLFNQRRQETQLKIFFLPALLMKVFAGIALGLIYQYYYKVGDTLFFHEDGVLLAKLARYDIQSYFKFLLTSQFDTDVMLPLTFNESRSLFLTKIVSVLSLVGIDNYWIISVYCSVISFLGAWYLVQQISRFFPQAANAAVVAFLFLPSTVFWTSGLIKETFAMAGLFFITGLFLRTWFNEKTVVIDWIIAILSAWVLWNLKYYFAAIFFSVIVANVFYRLASLRFTNLQQKSKYLLWSVLFIFPVIIVIFSHPNFYPRRFLNVIFENYNAFQSLSSPGDALQFYNLQPTWTSILINSPIAFFSGLFRPFIFEGHNVFSILIGIENLIFIVLAVWALRNFPTMFRGENGILLFATFVYILLLCTFITLSTPNFGTLARYRVGYYPFFVFMILLNPPVSIFLQRSIGRLLNIRG